MTTPIIIFDIFSCKLRIGFGVILFLFLSNFSFTQPLPIESDEYQRGVDAYAEGDYGAAAEIWLMEAYEGSSDAQFNLGVMFLEEKGVAMDRNEAIFWFTRAAELGHVEAQYNLGYMYFENKDNPELMGKGLDWWRRSAVQGFAIAQFNYGRAFFYGVGVEQNLSAAKFWMKQSARAGEEEAKSFLKNNAQVFAQLNASKTESTNWQQPAASVEDNMVVAEDHTKLAEQPNVSAETLSEEEEQFVAELRNPDAIESETEIQTKIAEEWSTEKTVRQSSGDFIVNSASDNSAQDESKTEKKIRRINRQDVRLLKSPESGAEPLFTVSKNTLVSLNTIAKGWAQVSIPGGFPVWLTASTVIIKNGKAIVSEDRVVMSLLPSVVTQNPELGKLSEGQMLEILEVKDQWIRVLAPQRVSAWVVLSDLNSVAYSDELGWEWLRQKGKLYSQFYKRQ